MSNKNQLKKKLQYGSISVVLVVVFIAAVILANLGVSFLTDRFNLKWDISTAGLYEISEQTEVMLKNLDTPVTAYILLPENDVENSNGYAQANELLRRYSVMSDGMFNIEYIDIYKNPTFIQKYETTSTLNIGAIILESEKRFKTMELVDLYELSTQRDPSTGAASQFISGFAADRTFASALHYVTTEQLPTVAKITGHGESYDQTFMELFASNNYSVIEINLAMEDIPATTDLILLGTPNGDYTDAEIVKLDAYLNSHTHDASAIVFTDTTAPAMPNFSRYVAEWGVEFKDAMVLDAERNIGYESFIAPYILTTEMTKDLSVSNNTILAFPEPRAMAQLWKERGVRTTEVIIESSDNAYSKSYANGNTITTYAKEDGDVTGAFPVCILSSQKEVINNEEHKTKVMFLASSYMTSSVLLSQQSMFNTRFTIAAINHLNPVVDAVSIEARNYTDTSLMVLEQEANVILITLVVAIPLVIMGLGLYVWLRRKNK